MARRFDATRLIVASHNLGKVREIAELLAPYRNIRFIFFGHVHRPIAAEGPGFLGLQ